MDTNLLTGAQPESFTRRTRWRFKLRQKSFLAVCLNSIDWHCAPEKPSRTVQFVARCFAFKAESSQERLQGKYEKKNKKRKSTASQGGTGKMEASLSPSLFISVQKYWKALFVTAYVFSYAPSQSLDKNLLWWNNLHTCLCLELIPSTTHIGFFLFNLFVTDSRTERKTASQYSPDPFRLRSFCDSRWPSWFWRQCRQFNQGRASIVDRPDRASFCNSHHQPSLHG